MVNIIKLNCIKYLETMFFNCILLTDIVNINNWKLLCLVFSAQIKTCQPALRYLRKQSDMNTQKYNKSIYRTCITIMLPVATQWFLVKNKTVILPKPTYTFDMVLLPLCIPDQLTKVNDETRFLANSYEINIA